MCMEKLNGEKRYIFWDTHSVQMAPKRNLDAALRVKSFKFTPKFLFYGGMGNLNPNCPKFMQPYTSWSVLMIFVKCCGMLGGMGDRIGRPK